MIWHEILFSLGTDAGALGDARETLWLPRDEATSLEGEYSVHLHACISHRHRWEVWEVKKRRTESSRAVYRDAKEGTRAATS